jgi:hypothetical protein
MKLPLRRILISAQIGALVALAPATSFAEEDEGPNIGAKIFDVMILRTLGSVRLVVGTAALAVTGVLYTLRLPFDSDTGPFEEAAEVLVVEPANYVFRRPLGEDFSGG